MSKTNSVLIVDDEIYIRDILCEIVENAFLGDREIDVSCAEDGEKAIEKISEQKYDLIFIDLRMPKISGFDVLEKIRSEKNPNQHTPFVVVSGNVRDLQLHGKDKAIKDVFFIEKPFEVPRITNITKMILFKNR